MLNDRGEGGGGRGGGPKHFINVVQPIIGHQLNYVLSCCAKLILLCTNMHAYGHGVYV